jgi:hypothetical protein
MDRLGAQNLVRIFVRVVTSIPTTFQISDNSDKWQNENFVLARNLLRRLNKTPKNLCPLDKVLDNFSDKPRAPPRTGFRTSLSL